MRRWIASVAATALLLTMSSPGFAAKEFTSGRVRVQDKRALWMEVKVTVNDDGKLFAFITTQTLEALAGFTGSALLILRDSKRNIIGLHKVGSYGVDGTHVPFTSPSERKDTWTTQLPPDVVAILDTVEIQVMRSEDADKRFNELLSTCVSRAKGVAKPIKDLGKILK